jgi:putative membrane protein
MVGGKGQWRSDLGTVFRGLRMGAADVIPGVSGGTVALIVGIYARLVTAIRHVDTRLLPATG